MLDPNQPGGEGQEPETAISPAEETAIEETEGSEELTEEETDDIEDDDEG